MSAIAVGHIPEGLESPRSADSQRLVPEPLTCLCIWSSESGGQSVDLCGSLVGLMGWAEHLRYTCHSLAATATGKALQFIGRAF